jgi:hypothetical protein
MDAIPYPDDLVTVEDACTYMRALAVNHANGHDIQYCASEVLYWLNQYTGISYDKGMVAYSQGPESCAPPFA